jgi:hypothetical protein
MKEMHTAKNEYGFSIQCSSVPVEGDEYRDMLSVQFLPANGSSGCT